jgi:predicted CopG family antitoxin
MVQTIYSNIKKRYVTMNGMHSISISQEILVALNEAMNNSEAKSYSELIGGLMRKNEAMRQEFAVAEGQRQ